MNAAFAAAFLVPPRKRKGRCCWPRLVAAVALQAGTLDDSGPTACEFLGDTGAAEHSHTSGSLDNSLLRTDAARSWRQLSVPPAEDWRFSRADYLAGVAFAVLPERRALC